MHLKRLNLNEVKKILDKHFTLRLESVPKCKDLAPDHQACTDEQQLLLEALLMADTGYTNTWEH